MDISKLVSLSAKEKLFIWLYFPYEMTDQTVKDMLQLGHQYSVPENIMIRKFIEYFHIKNKNPESAR